jgi:hypothetical protein
LYVKELDSGGLNGDSLDSGQREEVGEETFAVARGHGFGVELDPKDGKAAMAERHDLLPFRAIA